jgi:hypothetical protein
VLCALAPSLELLIAARALLTPGERCDHPGVVRAVGACSSDWRVVGAAFVPISLIMFALSERSGA